MDCVLTKIDLVFILQKVTSPIHVSWINGNFITVEVCFCYIDKYIKVIIDLIVSKSDRNTSLKHGWMVPSKARALSFEIECIEYDESIVINR